MLCCPVPVCEKKQTHSYLQLLMGSGADHGGDLQLHSAAGCCVLNGKVHSGYRAQDLHFWGGAF